MCLIPLNNASTSKIYTLVIFYEYEGQKGSVTPITLYDCNGRHSQQ